MCKITDSNTQYMTKYSLVTLLILNYVDNSISFIPLYIVYWTRQIPELIKKIH